MSRIPHGCKRGVVYAHPPDYMAWPSLARAADGTLLCVFSGEREAHVCPYGRIVLLRSLDDTGESWDENSYQALVNTVLDDRDPGLVVLPDGSWLLTWFSLDTGRRMRAYRDYYPRLADHWSRHLSKVSPQQRHLWHNHWSCRIDAQGWRKGGPVETTVSAPHGPILCPNGRLVYVGTARGGKLLTMVSFGDGLEWQRYSELRYTPERTSQPMVLNEPHGVALSDDELYVWWRQEFANDVEREPLLHACHSLDGGASWSKLQPTQLRGYPPHALKLADGRVLLSYGWRVQPYGVRACVFTPEARRHSYGEEYILVDDCETWDCGYPASVEVGPGRILTVYYETDAYQSAAIRWVTWDLED